MSLRRRDRAGAEFSCRRGTRRADRRAAGRGRSARGARGPRRCRRTRRVARRRRGSSVRRDRRRAAAASARRRAAPRYESPANSSTSASRNSPPRSLPGNSTASTPPTTHTIWKRVSKRANARPARRVGRVALDEAVEHEPPARGAARDRERRDAQRHAARRARREHEQHRGHEQRAAEDPFLADLAPQERRERSRRRRSRSRSSRARARRPTRLRAASSAGSPTKNVMNPTAPRSRPIAVPAATIARRVQLACAARSSRAPPTCFARGMRNAATVAATNTTAPTRSTHGPPTVFRKPAAIDAPSVPASTRDQLEARVGAHQLRLVVDDGRHQRALGDVLTLRQHERAERERVQARGP